MVWLKCSRVAATRGRIDPVAQTLGRGSWGILDIAQRPLDYLPVGVLSATDVRSGPYVSDVQYPDGPCTSVQTATRPRTPLRPLSVDRWTTLCTTPVPGPRKNVIQRNVLYQQNGIFLFTHYSDSMGDGGPVVRSGSKRRRVPGTLCLDRCTWTTPGPYITRPPSRPYICRPSPPRRRNEPS